MRLIVNQSTDPAFNLALEEHLLLNTRLELIMLWRNDKCVVVGRNQNAAEEVDSDYAWEQGIRVVRRLTGGGAVFHDLGNINWTIITGGAGSEGFGDFEKFSAPVCNFLNSLGVPAAMEGRNDILAEGKKISGGAMTVRKNRLLHHGTLLYSADLSRLAAVLKPKPAKYESKGIKSTRARVTNIAGYIQPPMPVEEFYAKMAEYFRKSGFEEYRLTREDKSAAEKLRAEKYADWDWVFGSSPNYTYQNERRFDTGTVELRLAAECGVIIQASVTGDFFGERDIAELEERLLGVRHDRESVAQALAGIDVKRYIHGVTADEFLELV